MRGRLPDHLEALLRDARPEPRRGLVDEIAGRVASDPSPRARLRRLGVAVAVTVVLLAPLGAFGGLGYAASAGKGIGRAANPVSIVRLVVSQPKHAVEVRSLAKSDDEDTSPADDQYKPGKGCGDKNHVHERSNECKKH